MLREQANNQIDVIVEQAIVERMNTYCRYVSPRFFIGKRGTNELRLVVNYRDANEDVKGIESELPCIYDSTVTLSNSVLNVLDINLPSIQ